MIWDDIIYLLLLIVTILIGPLFRNLKNEKEIFGTTVGIIIIILVSGFHAIHPLIATIFNICLLKFCHKNYIHILSFIGLFGYLLFFRICHLLSIPMPPPHTNAIQMILTLKLVGVCFEVHDTWKKKEKLKTLESEEDKKQLQLELKYEEVHPSSLDIFNYAFTYIGILTGPYYKFRTYYDAVHSSQKNENMGLDCLGATLRRARYIPVFAAFFLISNHFFPLSFAESEEIFRDYSILYRVLYMTPVFFTFRMRIYSGFLLSECACIIAGLGAYPVAAKSRPGKGPVNFDALEEKEKSNSETKDFDFETIHNIDEYGSDFSPTVRGGMRCWNMTVQFWLASNVYKRLKLAKAIKEALTMFVSAFWHGVYAGYYLSMLTVPFILAVEDFYDRLVRRKLSPKSQKVYDFITWFMKMQQFAYMGMGFLLLRIDATIYYWRSIGFIYHGLLVFLHAIAQYVNLINSKASKKLEKCRNTSVVGDTKIKFSRHGDKSKLESIGPGDIINIDDVTGGKIIVSDSSKKDD